MCRFFIVFLLLATVIQAMPTPTPTSTPTPTRTPPLGPGPIVSLWRARPNPIGSGSQQIRIANVGDAGTTLDDRSIYAASSGEAFALTGYLGPGENGYVSLPKGTLDVGGDIITLIKGGAIYQGYYDGPVAAGRWVHLKWTSETTLATTATPTPIPTSTPTPDGVRLYAILPNSSTNDDATGEVVWVKNWTSSTVSLDGWIIRNLDPDEVNQDIALSGDIVGGTERKCECSKKGAIFNNDDPDCIALLNANGDQVDSGTYLAGLGEDVIISFIPCP